MSRNYLYKTIFLLLLITGFNQTMNAQRFNGGLVGGINLAELDGNGIGSYFGINAGALVSTPLGERWALTTELLYSQDGEYLLPDFYPRVQYKKVRLDYIEIPLHIDYWGRKNEEEDFYDWKLSLGLAYTFLFNYHAEDVEGVDLTEQIVWGKTSAILIQAGTTYFLNPNFGINFRGTLSTDSSVLEWTLAFRGVYMFW